MAVSELSPNLRDILAPETHGLPEIPAELQPLFQALVDSLTEEKQKRTAAEAELAFLKASANAMPNPIFIKDENLRFVFFNHAYRTFFGLKEGENIGKQVQDLSYLSQEDRARYHQEDSSLLDSLSAIQYDTSYTPVGQQPIEALYWSKGFSVPATGTRGIVGEIVNITKEKETQRELARSMRALELLMRDAKDASKLDPLTKLYNRNILDDELPTVIRNTHAHGQPVCVMLIDVDYFKMINDTYGHPFGDEMLRRFAQVLKQTFRQRDIAVRYGGDEFLLLLPGADLTQAQAGAERFRQSLCHACELMDGQCVTLSIGITRWKDGDDLTTFISRADEALYESKKAGRDRITVKT